MRTDNATPDGMSWFTAARFAVCLLVLTVASFPDVLLAGNSFVAGDFGAFGYPLAFYHRQSFWRGEMPLWNPLSNCGLPFLAQWNTLVLYPPSLIYLLLPLPWSLNLFCLAHLFLGGLGMYLLARRWTGNSFAAAVAGLSFAFGGLTLHALRWPNIIAGLGWMPWVVLFVETACATGGRTVLLAAGIGALQMLSGAPEIIFFTWCIAALLWTLQIFQEKENQGKRLLRFASIVGLIAALASAQLLPFFDLSLHGERDYEIAHRGIPVWGVLNLFVPLFRFLPTAQGSFAQTTQYWTSSYYLGIAGLALFVAGCRWIRDRRAWVLLVLSIFGFLVAMAGNTPFYFWACKVIPGLDELHFPVKFVVFAVFALPLLAAMSVTALCHSAGPQKPVPGVLLTWGISICAIAGVLFFAHSHPLPGESWKAVFQSGVSRAVLLTIVLGSFLLFLQTIEGSPRQLAFGIVLLAGVWLDLFTHTPKQNPSVKPQLFTLGAADGVFDRKPHHGNSRITISRRAGEILYGTLLPDPAADFVRKRLGMFANCNLLDDVPKTGGFYSTYLPGQLRVLKDLFFVSTNSFPDRLADFLSVSYLSSSTDPTKWEFRPTHLPMATIGERPLFLEPDETKRFLLSNEFDPRTVACFSRVERERVKATNDPSAKILNSHFEAHHIEMETESRETTLLVLSQSFYHVWKAYVDGKPVEILNVNRGFQALQVSAGKHRVQFVYEDKMFRLGVVISAGALACCIFVWFWLKPRQQLANEK